MIRSCLLSLALVLGLASCADKKPEQFTEDKTLYEYATKLYKNGEYTQSIPFFESLKNRFPQSPYIFESELKIADAHFEKSEYQEALLEYENFKSLHPTNPKVPYAVYRIGMCHYKRVPGSVDRDLSHTQQAMDTFKELVQRWPDAPEGKDVRPLINKCQRQLVEREMYIANFYLKQDQYKSALLRLEALSKNTMFNDLKAEAQYKLGFAYYKLKQLDQAKTVLTELSHQTNAGKFQLKAQNLLKKISL